MAEHRRIVEPRVAVEPRTRPAMRDALAAAVVRAGAELAPLEAADAVIWADPGAIDVFPEFMARAARAHWVQLPYAGIESLAPLLDHERTWTCGKGVYADDCAEWMMTALLTAFRDIPKFVRADTWQRKSGRNLLGARITLLGGGGLAQSFLRLIEPWGCAVTVVRRSAEPLPGAVRTLTGDQRFIAVADADAVIVCLSLTPQTTGIVDTELLAAMTDDAWLINVARGGHVVTADLLAALDAATIGGAVLDVTDPEPLPDDHPLWTYDNVLITPHVGNTPEMGLARLVTHVEENVRRWIRGDELIGAVDVDLGY